MTLRSPSRRTLVLFALTLVLSACGGGAVSVLHAKGKASGSGPADLEVMNSSGVVIESLRVAKTEDVDKARAAGATPGSSEDDAVWGDDQLGNAGIGEGKTFNGLHLAEGRYDVLVMDHDRREQLVKGLKLRAGGRYTLEVKDDWTLGR